MKNFYDMLSLTQDAPADEIKKAFRREIARYHPDKVHHLGAEFQKMAADIAADLTEAYRILMDPTLRAQYDQDISAGRNQAPPPPAAATPERPREREPEGVPPPPRAANTAGVDFVKRAAMSKLREAIDAVLGTAEPLRVSGFDVALVTNPKKGLFRKTEEPVCLLVKLVAYVDAAAIAELWPAALRARAPGAAGCVLMLVGSGLAPARELAAAVTEQRRKQRATGPIVVPVDVRDWEALFPPETPAAVRLLIQRLKEQS